MTSASVGIEFRGPFKLLKRTRVARNKVVSVSVSDVTELSPLYDNNSSLQELRNREPVTDL